MSPTDLELLISTLAAVASAIYTGLSWHWPRKSAMTEQPQKATNDISASTNRWRPFWPIVLVIVAWGATAFGYADRHWLSHDVITDSPVAPNNARLDITKLDASFPSPNALWFNIHFINNGAATALHMANIGHSTITTTVIDPDIIDGEFLS
jgi:hypothetical protein